MSKSLFQQYEQYKKSFESGAIHRAIIDFPVVRRLKILYNNNDYWYSTFKIEILETSWPREYRVGDRCDFSRDYIEQFYVLEEPSND